MLYITSLWLIYFITGYLHRLIPFTCVAHPLKPFPSDNHPFFLCCYGSVSEKAMAPHSGTLALKIPWMEESGRLQSMRSLRVGHDWVTSHSLFTFMHWRRKWQTTQCSCLENPRDGGAWWAAVHVVAQSRTWLKRLSSSSNRIMDRWITYCVPVCETQKTQFNMTWSQLAIL